jgi:hypothetical protein
MKKILFVIPFCVLLSCEKEAKLKIPEAKTKPVVNCYLNPADTIIKLRLTMSAPLYNSGNTSIYDPVTNANVSIYSASSVKQMIYNANSNYYELKTQDFPLAAGETYKLKVTLANGYNADASTTIPSKTVYVNSLSFNESSTPLFKINFSDDPSNTNNYYVLSVSSINAPFSTDTAYIFCAENSITDANSNGGTYQVELFSLATQTLYPIGYDCYLNNVSKEYFQYYSSINKSQNQNLFSEPTLVYSNVNGGLGIFASYTKSRYRKFK